MSKIKALNCGGINEWLKDQPDKKDLRGALRKLYGLIQDEEKKRNDLTWWHDVGTCVKRFLPQDNRRYGENMIKLLVNYFRPGRDRKDWNLPKVLYRARKFVDKYKSRKDAESLGRKRNADNKPLTQLHIIVLLSVQDDSQREEFLKRCLAESWSGAELRRRVQNAMGRKHGTSGRPPRPSKYSSPRVALWDITVMTTRWTAFHKVWFVGQKAPLRRIRAQDQDEETLQELDKAKKGLEFVRDDVKEALTKVRLLERQIKSHLSAGSASRRAKSKKSS